MANKQIQSTNNNKEKQIIEKKEINNLDFAVFEDEKEECNVHKRSGADICDPGIVGCCTHLLRIAYSLKYYQLLHGATDLFIEFVVSSYSMYLTDYIHLICVHRSHLNEIMVDLQSNYNFKCGNIKECEWTDRHYRNRRNNKLSQETEFNFITNLFDTIHFYLLHLQMFGFRTTNKINHGQDQDEDEKKHDDDDSDGYLNCIDYEFGKMRKEIESKRKQYGLENERMKNQKFNIVVNTKKEATSKHIGDDHEKGICFNLLFIKNVQKQKHSENTFIDNMMVHLLDKNKNVNGDNDETVNTFSRYIETEEFDTDCIEYEINNKYGNFQKILNDKIKSIEQFLNHYKISSFQFSTGYIFFYWDWFKNLDLQNSQQFKEKEAGVNGFNVNDFGVESLGALYVGEYYVTIKEEALMSGYVSIGDWKHLNVVEVDYFLVVK